MVNQYVWIGIVVVAFFVGIGASYVNFANTYDPISMKFQNQELFDQMMSNNPRMSQQWMDTGMMNQQQMIQNPDAMNQWMQNIMNDPQAMQQLRQNSQFMSQLQNPALTNNLAINQNELMDQLSDESVLLLDIREIEQFDQGHIEGAATATCAEDKREKVLSRIPKSIKIILVDQDGTQAPEMVQLILDAGLSSQYLEGGMNNWQGEVVQDPGAKQITPEQLWNRIQQNDNIFLLDVRTPQEFLEYHITGSVNIPLEYTFDAETTAMIPDDKDVIVICKSGTRATVSSFALAKHGIAGAILDGGIVSWLEYLETKP
ncbi:putative Thiosulfate sulfurtransferase [metagenome]